MIVGLRARISTRQRSTDDEIKHGASVKEEVEADNLRRRSVPSTSTTAIVAARANDFEANASLTRRHHSKSTRDHRTSAVKFAWISVLETTR